MRLIPDFRQDLHHALRMLRRSPSYAIGGMLCLALGIGVNTTVFSCLDGMFLRKLPLPEPERVVAINRGADAPCSWQDYRDRFLALRSFGGIAAFVTRGTFLDVNHANDRIVAEAVSANYSDVLKIRSELGRWFLPSDEAAGEPVTVISDRIWDLHFHRDPQVIGRWLRIENQWYRVVGVAPSGFHGVSPPLTIDAWVPFVTYPEYRQALTSPQPVFLVGRLMSGVSQASAEAELGVIDAHLRTEHPQDQKPIRLREYSGAFGADSSGAAIGAAALLLGVVVVILLIACVNVSNLLLARATARQREIAVRQALGAGRGRLIRQTFAEGLLLANGGALLGLLLGYCTNRALSVWLPTSIPEFRAHTIYLM